MSNDPFSRQTRLREVGKSGQALIAAGHVVLDCDPASSIAADYLARSGVKSVCQQPSVAVEPFTHANHFTYSVTAQYARGAWLATRKIVTLLELPSQKKTSAST